MPPSGSHSSGGSFSHSSGSSGHSSRSKGYSSYSPYYPRTYIFWGRRSTVKKRSVLSTILLFLGIIALFLAFGSTMIFLSNKDEIKTLKNDYEVSYSELATTKPVNAKPLRYQSYQIWQGTTYYYVEFEVTNLASQKEKYETTATYTIQEAQQIVSSGVILVCYNGYDAIQASFDYSTDKEYAYKLDKFEKSQKGMTIAMPVSYVAGAVLIVFAIVVNYKYIKREEAKENADKAQQIEDKKETIYVCSYCGAKLPSATAKCPNCGAQSSEKKKI